MSSCRCGKLGMKSGIRDLNFISWVVIQRYCNHSAFRGYNYQASDYSQIRCLKCGEFWRTKAKYVYRLRDATEEERLRAI